MNKILKSWAVFEAARGCVEMKQMIVLFICLLLAAGFVSAYELNGWTYEYEVENAHTKSESIHGKLMCRGREMPKQYEHVITPLGEFIFADVSGFNTVEKIRWTPCGLLRSEEHTSELQSQSNLVCRLLLEKKKKNN